MTHRQVAPRVSVFVQVDQEKRHINQPGGCTVKAFHSILAGALMAALCSAAQAVPVSLPESIGGTNITSSGKSFTHVLPLSEGPDGAFDQALLSLNFHVSRNAAAQNDIVSLFIGGVLLASGRAADFKVTRLDVSDYFDFTTGTLTFDLFREVPRGGGVIKLKTTAVTVTATGQGNRANNDAAVEPQQSELRETSGPLIQAQQIEVFQIPEPGTLALFGFGLLAMRAFRRRAVRA
jgi:hypothetical protein